MKQETKVKLLKILGGLKIVAMRALSLVGNLSAVASVILITFVIIL
jgi:hypothetical protein